jgi:hypothetical protein
MEWMDLLHTKIYLIVPQCDVFGLMDLIYILIEGTIALESWGLHIYKEKFLAEGCPPEWLEPTKDSKLLDMDVEYTC